MKNLISTIVTAFIVLTLIFFYFFWFQGKREATSEALVAIPVDASFVLKINNYHRFSESLQKNNHIWESVKPFTTVAKVDSIIAIIDTLTSRSNAFNLLLTINPVYISTHVRENGSLEFLATVKIPNSTSKKELLRFVEELSNKRIQKVDSEYEDITISTLIDSYRSSEIASFAIINGLTIFSTSKGLVESSIHQINGEASLATDPLFTAISNTAGTKVDANFFINNRKLPLTFQKYTGQSSREKVNALADVAQWSELDINLKDDAIFLNGFTQVVDSLNAYLRVLIRQHPIESKISSIIPSETAAFVCLGISDLDKYLEDYRSYLDRTDGILEYTSALSDFKKEIGIDAHELYRSFFNNEIALVYASFGGVDYKDCWFVAIKTNGQSQTKQTFIDVLDSFAKSKKLKKSDFKSSLKIDDEKRAEIYKFPQIGINRLLFGSIFSEVSDEYFTFIDDYIIFGATKEVLTKIILANIHNNQLQLDVSYRQFSSILASSSNYFLYLNPHKAEKLFSNILDPLYFNALQDNTNALSKIQGVALQLSGGSRLIFNNITFHYSPYTAEDPQTTWETRLDTVFTMKPQVVINHVTKNQEILVQDLKNKIYLINDVGRILWSKQLPEPIIGEIAQVDLFNNDKLQYAFNTKSFIFAIDRRGIFVDGFPVKLKSKATNPVAIFDYEGNHDYRFFIACEDFKIYSFNNSGKPVAGWSFRKTERIVRNQLQYFRVKGKDYIVFADVNRPYVVDRKGDDRVSFPRYFSKSLNSKFVLDESHPDRLVTTDSVGLIKFVYFSGKIEDLAIKAFSAKHVFDFQDIDSDGKKEFLFLDKSQLYVYKQNKYLHFLYKFDAEIKPCILNINLSKSAHLLGFISSSSNKIYLINGGGSLYNGFPLKGRSPFSVAKLSGAGSTFNVLTGSSSGMLLNYSVK